ncbi:hypothetical protein FSARC_6507 [Fusarium sarcochroum]|uniref:Uncharacterized protein n=1 Tax=Fusarium sarcochroum TaxID=1208366 RepID=A0A8H4TXJ6_9HYPO|nr:hypothetical protein FSARC_6507 [Fusarium sarcochroum]
MSDRPAVGRYPGLGLNLRYDSQNQNGRPNDEIYPIAAHPNCYGADSDMLPVREVAMMIVMDRLTDKPDWHLKVFDDTITEKWIQEGLQIPDKSLWEDIVELRGRGPKMPVTILDRGCLEYCIKELRAKAKFFEKTGLIPTIDAWATAVKSDTSIDESLHHHLQAAFAKLKQDQKDDPDWHPRTNKMVQDLVHPSLYPLVYGRSRVFQNEVVGVEDAIDRWSGKGEVISPQGPTGVSSHYNPSDSYPGGSHVNDSFWSDTYQWLPSNFKFQDDGSVKFTSYINGLHPNKHPEIYGNIEKLIEKALPAWDLSLRRFNNFRSEGAGRTEARFHPPSDPDDEVEENWTPSIDEVDPLPRSQHEEAEVEESASNPASSDEDEDEDDDFEARSEGGREYNGTRKEVAWKMVRQPVQPEAPSFKAWNYGVKPGESLRERFKDLQVIVKMASIELTPEKPEFPAGGWHVEGQMNEHIVATALYYLDSENVTPSHLQFRMQTIPDQDDWNVGQDSYNWMERVYGTNLGCGDIDTDCVQRYGSVETRQGRLLAFPNIFHHRVSPFELQDKTKPGHRRFIALWLIDPLTRIINTGNVPPQQQSWWMERAFGNLNSDNAENVPHAIAQLVSEAAPGHTGLEAAVQSGKPLPTELMGMVQTEAGKAAVPMSLEEAKEHRLKLMDERSRYQGEARDNWSKNSYSFCEH